MAADYLLNVKDAELMQMMYEQDMDLGFDWHHLNEPIKTLNDVDNVQKGKQNAMDITDFFVDGETGEHIPITRKSSPPALLSEQTHLPQGFTKPIDTNTFNIEECLDLLDSSIPAAPQHKVHNQNEDTLWKDISELSDYASAGLSATNTHPQIQTQELIPSPVRLNVNEPQYSTSPAMVDKALITYNVHPNYLEPSYDPLPIAISPQQQSSLESFPVPTYSPPGRSPPNNFMPSPLASDDGIPMDIGFPPLNGSPERQDPCFSFRQLNNFSGMEPNQTPPYGGSPLASAFSEPGQGFFDASSNHDLAPNFSDPFPLNSASPPYANNMNGPYLNPHLAPVQPPPLNSRSPLSSFLEEPEQCGSSTVDKCAISEFNESDSGISDHSPKAFSFLEKVIPEPSSCSEDSVGSIPNQACSLQELNPANQNNEYETKNDTQKPLNKKKREKVYHRESRDEKRARELSLPFTLDEIILSAVEDYNEMLVRTPLTPSQQTLVKDIRRRGKNKVAAQNCRKRKIETISHMEGDVDVLRAQQQKLLDEQKELDTKKENLNTRYNALYQKIFTSFQDRTGHCYDPKRFRLEQVEGAVIIVPRMRFEQEKTIERVDFSNVKIEPSQ